MAEEGSGRKPEDNPELEKQLQDLESEGNEIAQRIQANVSQELSSHLAKLEEEFRLAFDDRIKMVTSQCKTQANEEVTKKQTDILRANKVFREVSRPLGDKWRPVFDSLISDLSPEQKRLEFEKVEREKPFMQPYKALMTWKEVRGEAFNIRELVPALRSVELDDLAQRTLSILDMGDKDALVSFTDGSKPSTSVGTTGAASKAPTSSPGAAAASGPATAAAATGAGSSTLNMPNVNAADALDDRHLLQVAKKLGGNWEELAKGLNVPSSEIAEIIEGEGKTYQGCFKMLWNWRESRANLSEGLNNLLAQLKTLNRSDVADLILS